MEGLLAEVDAVQQAARNAVSAGITGNELFEAAEASRQECRHGSSMKFVAHGMGLVSHEAPRLSDKAGVPYPAGYASRALEPGMVLSLETDLIDDSIGFVKLEDTVIVRKDGNDAFGDGLRGWNVPARYQ
jgi:Xaa-Pro aminopeptidase